MNAAIALPESPDLYAQLSRIREPLHIARENTNGCLVCFAAQPGNLALPSGHTLIASLPPMYPEWLGDPGFLAQHHVRFPYVAGEMATGIATTAMVIAMARAGMLGFFGSAGLPLDNVETAIDEIEHALADGASWGLNLIHSPQEPLLEQSFVDLCLKRKVRRVSASAFMTVTPGIVHYACSGLHRRHGRIVRQNHLFAKISRPELARQFMSPAPAAMLEQLRREGCLTDEEAMLARNIPLAEDITAEADSGGHTDNRPLTVLLPAILAARDAVGATHHYDRPIRVGAAGGLGHPHAVAAAFALGAAYVVTGSINQSAMESGTSEPVRRLLARAGMADTMMAPAADMFELGVKVQVLKRGTLFGARGAKLYQLYVGHDSFEAIAADTRQQVEEDILHASFEDVWRTTREYWVGRDAREAERADADPKHRMALVFRWYLGSCSRWAQTGDAARALDYQVWCGPAMGAFNDWVRGSFLEDPARRGVVQIALNLMEGAAVTTRMQSLRACGVPLPANAFEFHPRLLG